MVESQLQIRKAKRLPETTEVDVDQDSAAGGGETTPLMPQSAWSGFAQNTGISTPSRRHGYRIREHVDVISLGASTSEASCGLLCGSCSGW